MMAPGRHTKCCFVAMHQVVASFLQGCSSLVTTLYVLQDTIVYGGYEISYFAIIIVVHTLFTCGGYSII